MKIKVFLFGLLKDIAGRSSETLELENGAVVSDVLAYYSKTLPRFKELIPGLAVSVAEEYARPDRALREGDEVGLLPPVSGGSREVRETDVRDRDVVLVREPIDKQAVIARLQQPADGATVVFDGIVRDNTRGRRTLHLEYEAYEAMALKQLKSLATESRTRFGVRAVSIIHRLGRLEIGETSVLIAVASAHRGAAFDACRWIIDTLKKTVPIWKKEYFEDGAVWADGEPFPEEIQRPGGTAGGTPHPND